MIFTSFTYIWIGISVLIQAFILYTGMTGHKGLVPLLNFSAALFLLIVLIYRSLTIRFVALTGTFESLLFYALCILLISGFYGLGKGRKIFPAVQFFLTLGAMSLLLLGSSPLVSREILPPVPALQSGWLVLHVAVAFAGEAFFALSFVTALLALCTGDNEKIAQYDRLTYQAIIIGYPVFTVGALIFGAIWAEAAWGAFWSWDPKETWALITWLFYSLYLHFRIISKRNIRLSSWIAIIGFLSTLFTFFGVNYLLGGLHSYK